MTWRERIELAIVCMNHFSMTKAQFAEHYKTYARLLEIWHNRYYVNNNTCLTIK